MKELKKNTVSNATLKWVVVFLFSILIIAAAIVFREKLSHFRTFGLLGVFIANLLGSAVPFLPLPGIVTVVAGGALYSPLPVALLATLGAAIGDMITFLLGLSGRKLLVKKKYRAYVRLVAFMRRFGALTIFIFAFVPNPIFDTIGIFAGILEYPPYKFFLWMFLGRLARNTLLAFFGARFQTL